MAMTCPPKKQPVRPHLALISLHTPPQEIFVSGRCGHMLVYYSWSHMVRSSPRLRPENTLKRNRTAILKSAARPGPGVMAKHLCLRISLERRTTSTDYDMHNVPQKNDIHMSSMIIVLFPCFLDGMEYIRIILPSASCDHEHERSKRSVSHRTQ